MKLNRILLALLASATLATAATTLTYNFNTTLGVGVQSPTSTAPWISTSFTDVNPNQVMLVIHSNLNASEYLSKLAFNLDGDSFAPNNFVFTSISTSGYFDLPLVTVDLNSINCGNGSVCDLSFDFSSSNAQSGAKRFNQVDHVSYMINYFGLTPFSAASFDALDKSGQFKAIAHVQSIGTGNTSAWITPQIPEPSAALLGVFGLITLLRRKRP